MSESNQNPDISVPMDEEQKAAMEGRVTETQTATNEALKAYIDKREQQESQKVEMPVAKVKPDIRAAFSGKARV